jgi:dihydrofolate reductase
MRTLIAITHVSLDGVLQAPGGPEEDPSNGFTRGGWTMPFRSNEGRRMIEEIVASEFDLLLGRRTYDIWTDYWPNNVDHPIGKAFNKATKYVVTHRPTSLSWKTSEPIGGEVVDQVRRLKASKGPALHLWGSSEVLQLLIADGLIDEHRLFVFPVILGQGKRLFQDGVPSRNFTLVSTQSTPSGVLLNTYRPAGPIQPGR